MLAAVEPTDCISFVKQGERAMTINGAPCNQPPRASAGLDATAECQAPSGAVVLLSGVGSTDPDSSAGTQDDIASFEWFEDYLLPTQRFIGAGELVAGTLALGPHRITLKVTDRSGDWSLDEVAVLVVDTTPPSIEGRASPSILWPPNHRMVEVAMELAGHDLCGAVTVELVSIISSEPDDDAGAGDGSTSHDIQNNAPGTPDTGVQLRAERAAAGAGRVYTLSYRATDASGNASGHSIEVTVPHDRAGITEPLQIHLTQTPAGTRVAWDLVESALHYNVIRGRLDEIRPDGAGISLGRVVCLESRSLDGSTAGNEDSTTPAPGEAFFYLAEYNDGWSTSYGETASARPRVSISGSCE